MTGTSTRRSSRTQERAAARAGMSVRTLRRYERRGQLPSQLQQPRTYRTRSNPFADDWSWIVSQLERDPALQGTTLFRNAAGTWQTRQAQGQDTIPMGCLGNHALSLDDIYQDVLPV